MGRTRDQRGWTVSASVKKDETCAQFACYFACYGCPLGVMNAGLRTEV